MLTLEEIQERLRYRRIGIVADTTGINRKTLWAIVSGRTKNPSYGVIRKLSDYLEENK
jgi:transcriptional regulator with XRE-family HTH domain